MKRVYFKFLIIIFVPFILINNSLANGQFSTTSVNNSTYLLFTTIRPLDTIYDELGQNPVVKKNKKLEDSLNKSRNSNKPQANDALNNGGIDRDPKDVQYAIDHGAALMSNNPVENEKIVDHYRQNRIIKSFIAGLTIILTVVLALIYYKRKKNKKISKGAVQS